MKKSIILFTLLLGSLICSAQNKETVTVAGGQQLSDVVYLHEEFIKGNVLFKSGSRAAPLMNYNMLSKLVQFKDESGKIMDIDNPDDIATLSLGGKSYVYNANGYSQYIGLYGDIALTKQDYLLLRDILAEAGYGGQSGTTSASSMSAMEQSVDYRLPVGESRVYEKTAAYYLIKNGKSMALNQKNLAKCFPKQKAFIAEYFATNDVNLDDEAQVKALLDKLSE